ncbi:UDP-glycosyltransferase TURAN-like isoform X3 [Papaver somniferum]|nr:UDP-glycosyltransferase TURAN-like isoform X3 [Papaver somniferum]
MMAGQKLEEKIGKRGRAAVVVLGDIGRSPRMQYHALSLARQASLEVDIVAYGGSDPHAAILENRSIRIHKMTQLQVPHGLPKMLYPVILLCKELTQFFMLLWFLCYKIPAPDVFIVQNPPSVPTLVAVKWASWLRHSAIIVDWHNFGYTLLGLSMGSSSPFVKVYRWFEKHYGKMADGSLCVTQAMQHELAQNWEIKATVLYDQPPDFFHPASLEERHELFCRLSKDISHPHGFRDFVSSGYKEMGGNVVNENIFTYQDDSDIRLKSGRPVLVVSSTSWTADEDFGMLLEAAVMYDRRISAILDKDDSKEDGMVSEVSHGEKDCIYPMLLFIITGCYEELQVTIP